MLRDSFSSPPAGIVPPWKVAYGWSEADGFLSLTSSTLRSLHRCSVKAGDLIEEEKGSERATSSVLMVLASNREKEETPWPDDSVSESARS